MTELTILEESLAQKKVILARIIAENKAQEKALKADPADFDAFEAIVDKKTALIDELVLLDGGFESVYDRIRDTLLAQRDRYSKNIASLRALITDVTEQSVRIQAQEARNKALVEKVLARGREDIQTDRIRAKAAYDYMSRMTGDTPARFLDTRK